MRTIHSNRWGAIATLLTSAALLAACASSQPPVARTPAPPPAPAVAPGSAAGTPAPPQPVIEPSLVPAEPALDEGGLDSKSLDDLNRESPLVPVFFEYDSADVTPASQAALRQNAGVLERFTTWMITIEGHCDERGTAEYNLALGERRALAARSYLVSLGIAESRLRTVSYGKEFPFDPARTEEAFSKNRRAHFVVTAR
jgi:peptidoglycan-associated lipoprotein